MTLPEASVTCRELINVAAKNVAMADVNAKRRIYPAQNSVLVMVVAHEKNYLNGFLLHFLFIFHLPLQNLGIFLG